ncbi:hypothetical protein HDU91_006886 [Kappamyces sp. JEL0680]|nr:hypothetical protein HDU91_006886 [Kappamyces sp. JEL0680]
MFSLTVKGDTQKMHDALQIAQRLSDRTKIEPAAFDQVMLLREKTHNARDYSPVGPVNQDSLFEGTYYLGGVDAKFRRTYKLGVLYYRMGSRRKLFVLLGPSHAGKTLLFHRLRRGYSESPELDLDHAFPITVMSMEDAFAHLGATACIADIPGHPRLAWKVDSYLADPRLALVLFVVDAAGDSSQFSQAAQGLYNLLTHPKCIKRKPKVRIVCNKMDLDGAIGTDEIQSLLEKEM